jgi:putative sterol carrier protein
MGEPGQAASLGQSPWMRAMPLLSDFGTPLPRLMGADSRELDTTFDRLSQVVGNSEEPLAIRIRIVDGERDRSWLLYADSAGCRVTAEPEQAPDLEAIMSSETWVLIASGTLSPLEAFSRGRMRARGDLRTARRLVRQLYRSNGTAS